MCPHVGRALSNFSFSPFGGFFGSSKWAINFNKAKPCCVKKLALTHTHKALVLAIAQQANQFMSSNANEVQLQLNFYWEIGFLNCHRERNA